MPAKSPKIPRNYEIAPGLQRFSRSRLYHKKGLFIKMKNPIQKKQNKSASLQTHVRKPVGGDNNGKERSVAVKKAVSLI